MGALRDLSMAAVLWWANRTDTARSDLETDAYFFRCLKRRVQFQTCPIFGLIDHVRLHPYMWLSSRPVFSRHASDALGAAQDKLHRARQHATGTAFDLAAKLKL